MSFLFPDSASLAAVLITRRWSCCWSKGRPADHGSGIGQRQPHAAQLLHVHPQRPNEGRKATDNANSVRKVTADSQSHDLRLLALAWPNSGSAPRGQLAGAIVAVRSVVDGVREFRRLGGHGHGGMPYGGWLRRADECREQRFRGRLPGERRRHRAAFKLTPPVPYPANGN
jgi:hypothetical protein